MRIVLTGGGTGGHFYPLVAVAEAIEDICTERTLLEPELYFIGPPPFDEEALREHDITYLPSPAGKMPRHSKVRSFFGFFPTVIGVVRSTLQLFRLYPDIVFSSGGYAAFPTLYAAKLLNIPVVMYDADAIPGRVSLWTSKFARWIAIANPEAAARYPAGIRDRIARIGHPIRKEIQEPAREGAQEFLKLDPAAQTVFVLGGSQGAQAINNVIVDALPELVKEFNVVHQVGVANMQEMSGISTVVLKDSRFAERYKVFGLLNTLALRMAAGAATVVVARAGSGTIFELASWGLPAILIPIPKDVSNDQTENAFSYARSGAAVVIEQRNLTPHVLIAEIRRIAADDALRKKMSEAAHVFARPDAARKLATTLLDEALAHEPV